MPLLNYTTTIEAIKTVNEIQKILAKHGAKAILTNYDTNGNVESLSFLMNTPHGETGVKLPVNPDAVLKVMGRQSVPYRYRNRPQAVKIAWRIVKDWVEAQMAILETEMVQMEQIFLPYIEAKEGKTIYQLYTERQSLMLNEGNNA